MSSDFSILSVEMIQPHEAIDLRSRILRPGQPIENCIYEGDQDSSSFHLGIRNQDLKIICNGTFVKQQSDLFPTAKMAYRLRGMATDHLFQKQGFGSKVIEKAQQILKQKNADLLWFNARTSAELFYSKLGFSADPNIFDIPLAGPHKVMYKWLDFK